MPFLRSLLKDLVEKRLWPVAVLLVAALAAVPMLVGRSGPPAPAPTATPAAGATADAGTSSKASVTLVTDPGDERHDEGRVRDPFKSPIAAKKTTEAKATAPAGAAVTTTSSAGSTAGSTVTIKKTAPTSTASTGTQS